MNRQFFYNSISELGQSWEYEIYSRYDLSKTNKTEIFRRLWITKYDLIRNTLNNDVVISEGIKITDYYPLINLERKEELCTFGPLPFAKSGNYNICKSCLNQKYYGYPYDGESLKAEANLEKLSKANDVLCTEQDCITKRLINEIKDTVSTI